jgi:hypothetical protein
MVAAALASGLLAYLVVASSNVVSLGENVAVRSCSSARDALGGLQSRILRSNIMAEILPANVRKNADGTVDFIINCEASMYQASTGAVWWIVPQYGITCARAPAYHIRSHHIFDQTLCRGDLWKPDGRGGPPERSSGSIEWTEVKVRMDCGLWNLGALGLRV